MSDSAEEEEDHRMPRRKKHAPEEIVAKLRQVEVLTGQGTPVSDAIRAIGVTEATPGRAARGGDLQLTAGGAGPDRELATPLQCDPAALGARLPPAGP
jgi:hypothetical protein